MAPSPVPSSVCLRHQPWMETPDRVKRVVDRFKDPNTKVTLLFLQYILPVLMDFNKLFQVSVIINGAP